MRKLLTASIASAVLVLGGAGPALAHDAGPCGSAATEATGQQYAEHHIVFHAHEGTIGSNKVAADHPGFGHSPGAHHGFSLCVHLSS
jgi:hypothetical protein